MTKKAIPLLALALLGLPSVGAAQDDMAHDDHEMEMDHEAMHAEIIETIEAQTAAMADAFNARDAAAVAGFYAENAISMPPGAAALEGRAAIQQYMNVGFAQMQGMKMTFETKEVMAHHDHSVETGSYSVDAEDGTHIDHGKYITVWGQTSDGWKIVRDIWNSSMGGGQ